MGVVVGRTPAHKETPQRQEGDADLAWIPTWDTREGRWLREQRLRDQPRPPPGTTGTHPPPQERGQLQQQHLLNLHAQVGGDALGLDLALGDDLQG